MYILGLTGSLAMGKTWGTVCFRHFGVPVHDADACVHDLLATDHRAIDAVENIFPGVKNKDGSINRQKLSRCVFGHPAELAALEYILHPLVHKSQHQFLARYARAGEALVVLDIPLLFETGAQFQKSCFGPVLKRMDGVVVMSAPAHIQYARARQRFFMSDEKFQAIKSHQMPDALKCLGADFVVKTGGTKQQTLHQILKIIKVVKNQKARAWKPGWLQM